MHHFSSQKIVFNQKKKREWEIFCCQVCWLFILVRKEDVGTYSQISHYGDSGVPQLRNNARAGELSSRQSCD